MSEPIEIESIQRLDVKPGDTLVVTLPDTVTRQDFEHISDVLRSKLPEAVKLLIVNGTVRFNVVSSSEDGR